MPVESGALRNKSGLTGRGNARAVVLVGFMGAGKTSVGRTIGKQLGWRFEDLDDRIENRAGRKVSEIFGAAGESGFRRAEHAAVKEMLSELPAGAERIVALGGGAFVQKRNARLIESAAVPIVFLDAGADELWRRCRRQAERSGMQRPLLKDQSSFRELYEVRRPHYLRAPFRVETSGKTVQQIAAEVIQALSLDRAKATRGRKK